MTENTKEIDSETGAMTDIQSREFNHMAQTIFAPAYPVIAHQILSRTGITKGIGLDIGSGPGNLAMEIVKISHVYMYILDISHEMCTISRDNITENYINPKIFTLQGDVKKMNFKDSSIDLIISRGSWFFWEDLNCAFKEIYRVLKKDGFAYIGGGFGTAVIRDSIIQTMVEKDPSMEKGYQKRLAQCDPIHLSKVIQTAGFSFFNIINDDSGFWMIMKKTSHQFK